MIRYLSNCKSCIVTANHESVRDAGARRVGASPLAKRATGSLRLRFYPRGSCKPIGAAWNPHILARGVQCSPPPSTHSSPVAGAVGHPHLLDGWRRVRLHLRGAAHHRLLPGAAIHQKPRCYPHATHPPPISAIRSLPHPSSHEGLGQGAIQSWADVLGFTTGVRLLLLLEPDHTRQDAVDCSGACPRKGDSKRT